MAIRERREKMLSVYIYKKKPRPLFTERFRREPIPTLIVFRLQSEITSVMKYEGTTQH